MAFGDTIFIAEMQQRLQTNFAQRNTSYFIIIIHACAANGGGHQHCCGQWPCTTTQINSSNAIEQHIHLYH
jgi:hypothetical protein